MSGEAPESEDKQPGAVPPPAGGSAPPNHGHIEFNFLEQLKHRNVFRVAALYVVVCWLILEPVHVIFHMLEVQSGGTASYSC